MVALRLLAAAAASLAALAAGPSADAQRGCAVVSLRTTRLAYAGFAPNGAVAYSRPGGSVVARFRAHNANGYPTLFGVLARDCAGWYRVQLPVRPNGSVGWIRAELLVLRPVRSRVVVDLSRLSLRLYRSGRLVLRARVGIGARGTPTPTGSYYVNQRLVPTAANGPFGPAALGISAFSPTLTWWPQGGPIAIHGTDQPWSIGRAVSNGCVRLDNTVLRRVFADVPAGTPVLIRRQAR